MNSQTAFTMRRAFTILWDKAGEGSIAYDTGEVREWLEVEGWPTLFPGHCFTCHMNEHDPCKPAEHLSCPGCKLDQALDDPAWTHGGSRTDCGGVDCDCPEAAHE